MENIYRVSFFKRITGGVGHCVDACQGVVEVRGETKQRAIENARHRFAELKSVEDWSLFADYNIAEVLPGRTRISRSVWPNSLQDDAVC